MCVVPLMIIVVKVLMTFNHVLIRIIIANFLTMVDMSTVLLCNVHVLFAVMNKCINNVLF